MRQTDIRPRTSPVETSPASSFDEAPTAAPVASFTLGDLLTTVLRHKILILLATVLGAAAALGLALRMSEHYSTEAALIWDTSISAIIDGDTGEARSLIDPSATSTIVETLTAPAVIEGALAKLSPQVYAHLMEESGIAAYIATAKDSGVAELERPMMIQYLLRNVTIFNSGRSYVIRIYTKSTDPETAAAVANAVADAYLAYRVDLKRAAYGAMLSSLNSQLADFKAKLDAADVLAQTKREEARLLSERSGALTGAQRDAAVAESANLFASLREAEREAEAAGSIYEKLLRNQREIQSRMQTPEVDVQLFAKAVVPLEPSGFNAKPVLVVLGAAGGFFVGVSLALFRERMRQRRPAKEA